MRRKRLQHHTDIFCDMFSGWKIVNDMKVLTELKNGIIEFDFINRIQKLNGIESKIDFNMFYEISDWFATDLKKHNINSEQIEKANVKAEFDIQLIPGKEKSRTKSTTELCLNMNATILTNEKEYQTAKKETLVYDHIR